MLMFAGTFYHLSKVLRVILAVMKTMNSKVW